MSEDAMKGGKSAYIPLNKDVSGVSVFNPLRGTSNGSYRRLRNPKNDDRPKVNKQDGNEQEETDDTGRPLIPKPITSQKGGFNYFRRKMSQFRRKKSPNSQSNTGVHPEDVKLQMPSAESALSIARNNRLKKKNNIQYSDEIVVLGERVRLNELNVADEVLKKHVPFSDFVYFTPAYFPEGSEKAKLAFSKLFTTENPTLTCKPADINLIIKGLKHRYNTLEVDVIQRRNKYGDSMYTRQGLEQLILLEKAIDEFGSDMDPCNDGEERRKPLSSLDEERINALLRQFSFLVLQAMRPNDKYKTSIDPVEFVESLEEDAITKDGFDKYMNDTVADGLEIPESIRRAVDLSGEHDMCAGMLIEEIRELVKNVIKGIKEALNGTELLNDFNKDTRGFDINSITKENVSVELIWFFQWLISHYAKAHTKAVDVDKKRAEAEALAEKIRTEHDARQTKIAELTAAHAEAQAQAQAQADAANKRLTELEASGNATAGELATARAAVEEARAATQTEIGRIKDALAVATGARDAFNAQLINIQAEVAAAKAEAAAAADENTNLQKALAAANKSLNDSKAENARITNKLTKAKYAVIKNLKEINTKHKADTALLNKNIEILKKNIADLQSELSAKNSNALEDARTKVINFLNDIKQKLDGQGFSWDNLSYKLNPNIATLSYEDLIEEATKFIKGLQNNPALNQELANLTRELEKLKALHLKALHRIKPPPTNPNTRNQKVLNQQIRELNVKLTEAQAAVETAKKSLNIEIAEKNKKIDELNNELQNRTVPDPKHANEITARNTEIATKKAEIAARNAIIQRQSDAANTAAIAAQAAATTIANQQKQMNDLKVQLDNCNKQHFDLVEQSKYLKTQIQNAPKDSDGKPIDGAAYNALHQAHEDTMTKITALEGEIASKNAEITELTQSNKARIEATIILNKKNNELKEQLAALNKQKEEQTATINRINTELENKDNELINIKDQIKNNNQLGIDNKELNKQIDKLKEEMRVLNAKKGTTFSDKGALNDTKMDLTARIKTLTAKIDALKKENNSVQAGFMTKILQISNAITKADTSGKPLSIGNDDNQVFDLLYKKMEEYDKNLRRKVSSAKHVEAREICYLNYFVGFFIKQIFFTQLMPEDRKASYTKLDGLITEFLQGEGRGLDLGKITQEIYHLLYTAETHFLSLQDQGGQVLTSDKAGYYVIEGAEHEFIDKFYTFITNHTAETSQLEAIILQAFPDYFFNTSTISFRPPLNDSETSDTTLSNNPGFLLLIKNEITPNITKYTKIRVDGPPEDINLGNNNIDIVKSNTTLRYPTMLTFYILFARRYLISISDRLKEYHCPLSFVVTNPEIIQNSKPAISPQITGQLQKRAQKARDRAGIRKSYSKAATNAAAKAAAKALKDKSLERLEDTAADTISPDGQTPSLEDSRKKIEQLIQNIRNDEKKEKDRKEREDKTLSEILSRPEELEVYNWLGTIKNGAKQVQYLQFRTTHPLMEWYDAMDEIYKNWRRDNAEYKNVQRKKKARGEINNPTNQTRKNGLRAPAFQTRRNPPVPSGRRPSNASQVPRASQGSRSSQVSRASQGSRASQVSRAS